MDQAKAKDNLTLTEKQHSIINSIHLAGLTQKDQVRQLKREEISVFSVNDQDIGRVKIPQMRINLKDQVPVQQNNNSIPKQLYSEMKYYIEDLLNTLSVNPTKWSNTRKEFVGNSRQIVWVCLTILWGWHLKG